MYYLQSRYYNPEWGRFINADGILGQTGKLLGHNLFAYCKNNSVNMIDPDGDNPLIIGAIVIALQTLIDAAAVVIGVIMLYNSFNDRDREAVKPKTKAVSLSHGNSKKSRKSQHGYEIYNKKDGDVVKVGISGGKIRLDGK